MFASERVPIEANCCSTVLERDAVFEALLQVRSTYQLLAAQCLDMSWILATDWNADSSAGVYPTLVTR